MKAETKSKIWHGIKESAQNINNSSSPANIYQPIAYLSPKPENKMVPVSKIFPLLIFSFKDRSKILIS
jgi:hypothetical protein